MARISLVFSRVLVNFTGFFEIRWRYMNSTLHTAHTHTEIALSSDIYMGLSIFFLSDDDAEVASKRGQILSADKTTINLATTDNNKQHRKSLPLERHFFWGGCLLGVVVDFHAFQSGFRFNCKS